MRGGKLRVYQGTCEKVLLYQDAGERKNNAYVTVNNGVVEVDMGRGKGHCELVQVNIGADGLADQDTGRGKGGRG